MKNDINSPQIEIDRMIHEPARLLIMVHLAVVREADFRYLLYKTKLSRGNLSVQLQKLEAAGYIRIEKQFIKRIPRTVAKLTKLGRTALDQYKSEIVELLSSAEESLEPADDLQEKT
ncbi:MAG TPA: transcriptional regulator [Candidatus Cloacimonadota bacterium]|nr:transcriptional regulator [Candidatus Cloacimonadota bacterium]